MGRRAVFVSLVVMMFVLLGAPAAFAGAGGLGNGPDRDGPPGLLNANDPALDAPKGSKNGGGNGNAGGNGPNDNGTSANGASNAAENATRGMNRVGSPGEWKENGHVPAAPSFPQGRSPSDPDADGNGGMDKPGRTGGFDADKDGNNGCGNDADREDDNNGWCGPRPRPVGPEGPPTPPPPPPPGGSLPPAGPQVLPRVGIVAPPPAIVTGPAQLPRTGIDVGQTMIAGWGLVLAGTSIRARTRRGNR